MTSEADTLRKIESIACLEELGGYEAEGRKRGLTEAEVTALHQKRRQLSQHKI